MSDTPRTDAEVKSDLYGRTRTPHYVKADFARTLERELTTAITERDEARKERDFEKHIQSEGAKIMRATIAERDACRAQVATLTQQLAEANKRLGAVHITDEEFAKAGFGNTAPQPSVCKHCGKVEGEHGPFRNCCVPHLPMSSYFTPDAPEDVRPVSGERQEGDENYADAVTSALTTATARLAAQDRQITELTERLTHRTVEHEAVLALVDLLTTERDGAFHSSESWELLHAKRHEELTEALARIGRTEHERDIAQKQNAAMREALRKLSDGLECWEKGYEAELDSCDRWAKWCEEQGDTHGMNFHQGLRSGLVNTDILLDALKKAVSAAAESALKTGGQEG